MISKTVFELTATLVPLPDNLSIYLWPAAHFYEKFY